MRSIAPTKQRQFAVDVVILLRSKGFQAFWAGGCVRDQLLNRTPCDYDVATDAKPDEIQQAFGRHRTLAIGAAFGVINVLGPPEAGQVEVTTFRQDAVYSDGRHPDHVTFSSPEEDARRRDFTINGMFFDPIAEQVIDYVGGQSDLQAKIVRAIGSPGERFAEDKLRMLRAVRFAAALDFQLDPATLAAVRGMASELTVVSAERIAAEIERMLVGPGRANAARLLWASGLLNVALPELSAVAGNSGIEEPAAWQATVKLLESLPAPTFALGLAVLLHGGVPQEDSQETQLGISVGRRWRLAKKDFLRIDWLLRHWGVLRDARRMTWSHLQPLLVHEGAAELLQMHEALVTVGDCDPREVEYCRRRLAAAPEELDPAPLITGDDLIAHGVPKGKAFAWLLEQIRAAQLDALIHDKAAALRRVDDLLKASKND